MGLNSLLGQDWQDVIYHGNVNFSCKTAILTHLQSLVCRSIEKINFILPKTNERLGK